MVRAHMFPPDSHGWPPPPSAGSRPPSGRALPPLFRPNRREFASLLATLVAASSTGPLWAAGPAAPVPGSAAQPESTRRMAALLDQIRRDSDPMRNPFRSAEQLTQLRAMVPLITDIGELLTLRVRLFQEILATGAVDDALAENHAIERLMQDRGLLQDERLFGDLKTREAICYLRMGEQENCQLNHNADSCLFPIRGGGVHTLQRGSRGAVAVLTELLDRHPGDLRARWLLNIAYMTLGEYPDKVPARWLIDPKCFASECDFPRYPDIAADLGLDIEGHAGGIVLEDFDNDGFLDLMVSSWGLTDQLRFFHNNGDGTFTERTEPAGLLGEVGGLNVISADYNNDGFMDVLVLRGAWLRTEGHYPFSLLRNNGNGTFTDVTEEAGLLCFGPTQSAVWFDYNGDGWLDLFVVHESGDRVESPCALFRNNGDGTFTECARDHGLDLLGFFKGVATGDYNNDGRPDLFLSRLDGPRVLLRNDGPAGSDTSPRASWRFTDVTDDAGIIGPPASFPCWFFDYNNDGWLDLLVTGYRIQDVGDVCADVLGLPHGGQRARLYRNNGDGTFTDVSKEMGLDRLLHSMGANFGDLDNDGWLDFYLGTGDPNLTTLIPNRMFRNDGGRRFLDVTTAGGFGQLQKGHGIAFGDLNNNGEQDVYSVVGGAYETDSYFHQVFANPGHGNNWIKLKLEGVKTNRCAMGARIKVVVPDGTGERGIHRVVGTGGSFGTSPIRQEIGLGPAQTIARVEVFWPVTGVTQVVTGLEINRLYHLREGEPAARPVALKSFPWPPSRAGHHHHHHGGAMPPPAT